MVVDKLVKSKEVTPSFVPSTSQTVLKATGTGLAIGVSMMVTLNELSSEQLELKGETA
jgi:hypothetical protein